MRDFDHQHPTKTASARRFLQTIQEIYQKVMNTKKKENQATRPQLLLGWRPLAAQGRGRRVVRWLLHHGECILRSCLTACSIARPLPRGVSKLILFITQELPKKTLPLSLPIMKYLLILLKCQLFFVFYETSLVLPNG